MDDKQEEDLVTTPTIEPTWDVIAQCEPRVQALETLVDMAVTGIPDANRRWCANSFFINNVKPFVVDVVGWGRGYPIDEAVPPDAPLASLTVDLVALMKSPEDEGRRPASNAYESMLRTPEAYDLVHERLYAKLPDCRDCLCY